MAAALGGGLAAILPPDAWKLLTGYGVAVRFSRGQILFDQGDSDRHVYVILSGTVKVARSEGRGGETILNVRTAGDVVGDMAALDGQPRSATVTALSAMLARTLTGDQFCRYLGSSVGINSAFTRYTVARLREADTQRAEIALLPVRLRLARCLLRHASPSVMRLDRMVVTLPQVALAQMVGASRNAIVAELARMRLDGLLSTGRGTVRIDDPAALRHLACEPTGSESTGQ
ncbi:MAG TPA: Crp/Fnr family transcriptional regulator [Micromonosporaceae bacterium]|jgi:CRP-like cAMP-binding protein